MITIDSSSVVTALSFALLIACNGDDTMGPTPVFPEDYEATYTEVRDCRQSGDHDLNIVRVLASPDALVAYRDRMEPFPVGAVVMKEEYEFGDVDCAGPIKQWTVMQKLPVGTDAAMLDWFWQRVDADGRVLEEDTPRCAACHQACGVPPDGYDGTCTVP